ncbi:MAG: DHH family phosphoesterase [Thermoguttaceae bacterium]
MAEAQKPKLWIARPYDPDAVERIARQTKISPLVAQALLGRGFREPDKIVSFLAPPSLSRGLHNPVRLPGCVQAAKFLAKAIRAQKQIVVYGDYDVDGMTATAVLLQGIKKCGGKCVFYVPNRLEEGYGLNCAALKRLKEENGAQVVATVDCGIMSLKEAAYAKELGLDLVITDHHSPLVDEKTGRQVLPDCPAIVHPKLEVEGEPPYPFPEICGAFVAFKLAWQLGVEMGPDGVKTSQEMREFLLGAIGYAALGTIADVVPLRDENRTLVRYALERSLVDHLPMGVKFLLEYSSTRPKRITSDDVGYMIAPRLNAAGREVLNESTPKDADDEISWQRGKQLLAHPHQLAAAGQMGLATLGVELLITNDPSRARELAPYVNSLNATRQKLERRIMTEALQMINERYLESPAFVLASPSWHPGVIGVVAGRLSDRFYKPTVMIALRNPELNPGSARGVPDSSFNMYQALDACSDLLVRYGGHAGAAGLGIKENNVDAFREKFCQYVSNHFNADEYQPRVYLDGEAPFAAITLAAFRDLERLAPFGAENPSPVFATYGVTLVNARRVGKVKPGAGTQQGNVCQARFKQFQTERKAVAFNHGDWADELERLRAENPNYLYDVAYSIAYNDFYQQVELRLLDWRLSTLDQHGD